MEERKLADYFLVAGIPKDPELMEDYSNDNAVKCTYKQDPIVEIVVINKTLGESPPFNFTCVDSTPSGYLADLNHGSIRAHEMFICHRRGRDKPPLEDIGVLYESRDIREVVRDGCEVLRLTPYGKNANINNSTSGNIFLTFRRAQPNAPNNALVVQDLAIIITSKGETVPKSFCQIDKNLNRGMVGSDVYLCYKKSMAKTNVLTYKPAILGRYPMEDNPQTPLAQNVPMFCHPLGVTLESWKVSSQHPLPDFTTFVLTLECGDKIYGSSVSFFEEIACSELTLYQQQALECVLSQDAQNSSKTKRRAYQNKSICLVSRWPLFSAFRQFLSYVYRVSVSGEQELPVERLVHHFLTDVPFPSPQRPHILLQYNSGVIISISQLEDSLLPQSGASFATLLRNLGPENCLTLLLLTLLESKILVHSLRHAALTAAAEAIINMIFPCHWQCPYIPLCPLGLSDVLSAPTPFVVGVDSRYFDLYDPPPDVVCVDLDTSNISLPDDKKAFTYKLLPKKPVKVMKQTLERLFVKLMEDPFREHSPLDLEVHFKTVDLDFMNEKQQLIMEMHIQEAFLRFMACIMKGYSSYLRPIPAAPTSAATDLSSLFDINGFLKSRPNSNQKFFSSLLRTQLFSRFIEERSFVSDKDASLVFFDDCIDKVSESCEEPKLLDVDLSRSERTVFILPPEPTGLPPGATYSYKVFPTLDPNLFPEEAKAMDSLKVAKSGHCPNSPLTRRTKQEVKSTQKMAQKQHESPSLWAKCLLGHCYSLWFIHLPSYVHSVHSKTKALRTAYSVLVKMQGAKLQPPDELCYRILLQLCGVYQQPVLAVKVLFEMRENGVQPNAITYGFYNKAVLESRWPSTDTNAYLLWVKLKHTVKAVAQFKQVLKTQRRWSSALSESTTEPDGVSHTSTDSYLDENIPIPDNVEIMVADSDNIIVVPPSNRKNRNIAGNQEERSSTGGLSDKGYSSMTLDDTKRTSQLISSQESLEQQPGLLRLGKKAMTMNPYKRTSSNSNGERKRSSDSMLLPEVEAVFREKIGSIVRNSTSSVGSNNTLRGSTCSSVAGLLMTSEASLDGNVFSDNNLNGLKRQSSFDIVTMRYSKSMSLQRQSSDKTILENSEAARANVKENDGDEEKTPTIVRKQCVVTAASDKTVQDCDVIVNNCDIISNDCDVIATDCDVIANYDAIAKDCDVIVKDGDVTVKDGDVTVNDGDVTISNCSEGSECGRSGETAAVDSHSSHHTVNTDVTQDTSVASGVDSTTPPIGTLVDCSGCTRLNDAVEDNVAADQTQLATDRMRLISDEGFLHLPASPSKSGSPLHKERTPVTENDPLGLFSTPSRAVVTGRDASAPRSASQPLATVTAVDQAPVESYADSKGGSTPVKAKSSRSPGMERQGSFDSSKSKSGSGKVVTRNKSFMSSMKSAATGLMSRFSHIKDTYNHKEGGYTQGKDNGSQDTKWGAEISTLNDDKELLDNVPDSTTKTRQYEGYAHTPFGVTGLLNSAMSSSTVKTFQKGLVTLKNTVIEKVQEQWAIEDSDEDDEGYTMAASLADAHGASDKGSAPPHSLLDSYRAHPRQRSTSENDGQSVGSGGSAAPPGAVLQERGSAQSLPALFGVAMEVEMCSLSRCHSCLALLYDEEIMAGWTPDDSNLNSFCQMCGQKVVPLLQIYVKDFRQCTEPSSIKVTPSTESINCTPSVRGELRAQYQPSLPYHHTSHTSLMSADRLLLDTCPALATPTHTRQLPKVKQQRSRSVEDLLDCPDEHFGARCDENVVLVPMSVQVGRTANVRSTAIRKSSPPLTNVETAPAVEIGTDSTMTEDRPDQARCQTIAEQFNTPYLSPLVLRKEMETIIGQEGDLCLTCAKFADEHPIIYWNLLWYFKRIEVESHLPGFLLTAKITNQKPVSKAWQKADARHVQIRTTWDNVRFQTLEIGSPMYIVYNKTAPPDTVNALITEAKVFSQGMLQHTISKIMCNDVVDPLRRMHQERLKNQQLTSKGRFRSAYRDILFLSFQALGRENIDHDAFDREYKLAWARLHPRERQRYRKADEPPSPKATCCRRAFSGLEL